MREKVLLLIVVLTVLMFSIDAPCKHPNISQQAYFSRVPMLGQRLFLRAKHTAPTDSSTRDLRRYKSPPTP